MKKLLVIATLLLLASCSSNPPSKAVDFTGTFRGYFTASDGSKGNESSISISGTASPYDFTARNLVTGRLVGSGTCAKVQGKTELFCAFDSETEVFTFEGPHDGNVFRGTWDYISISDTLNGTFRFTRE